MTDTVRRHLDLTPDQWAWFWAWGREHNCAGYNHRLTAQAIIEEWRRRDATVAAILELVEKEQAQ